MRRVELAVHDGGADGQSTDGVTFEGRGGPPDAVAVVVVAPHVHGVPDLAFQFWAVAVREQDVDGVRGVGEGGRLETVRLEGLVAALAGGQR